MSFVDERNEVQTTLAVVGDNNVHLLNGRDLGFSRTTTAQGPATDWMKNGIFKLLGKE